MSELAASRSITSLLQTSVDRLSSDEAESTRRFLTAIQDLPRFVFEIARTVDEHDDAPLITGSGVQVPGKPFPDWPFLREVVQEYLDHRLILVEKARQLMLTWLFSAIVVWEVRSKPNQRWGWTSINSDNADAALQRMWEIITRLPGKREKSPVGHDGFRDAGGVMWTRAYGRIQLPQMGGNIHGMSQSVSAARSFTMSGVVMDEIAFLPWAREAYSAIKPTIDSGRFVGITTPGPFGWTHDLYQGKDFGEEFE